MISTNSFFDELEKIAKVQKKDKELTSFQKAKETIGKAGAGAVGVGLGTAAGMLVEKAFRSKLGPAWNNMDPNTRYKILVPTLAVAGLAASLATKKVNEKVHGIKSEDMK